MSFHEHAHFRAWEAQGRADVIRMHKRAIWWSMLLNHHNIVLLALRTDNNMETEDYASFHAHFKRSNVLVYHGIVFFKSLEGRPSTILTEDSAVSEHERAKAASNRCVLQAVANHLEKIYM